MKDTLRRSKYAWSVGEIVAASKRCSETEWIAVSTILLRELRGSSYPEVGRFLQRAHSTCVSAVGRFSRRHAPEDQARILLAVVVEMADDARKRTDEERQQWG